MRLQRRVHAGIFVCLILLAHSVYVAADYARARAGAVFDTYRVGDAVKRFAPVAAALPAGTEIGYITDLPAEFPERATFYATARYAVAPLVLHPEPAGALLLGDLKRPGEAAAFIARERLQVERDFGNGVYLFRRANP